MPDWLLVVIDGTSHSHPTSRWLPDASQRPGSASRRIRSRVEDVQPADGRLLIIGEDGATLGPVDEIVCSTGFRPDLTLTRELRLDLDDAVEAPAALAPLIDPNVHSCGSVRPHGAEELKHPEPNFYTVGMKSYGRAPTFLLSTGYEQVRSVAAAIVGDWESARKVELVLPETGACSTGANGSGGSVCCGSEPADVSAVTVSSDALLLPILDLSSVSAGTPMSATATMLATHQSIVAEPSACCSTAEQSTCCEPSDKAECCGATAAALSSGCGCR